MEAQRNVTFSNISIVLNNSLDYDDSYSEFYLYADCKEPENFGEFIRNKSELICKREPLNIWNFEFGNQNVKFKLGRIISDMVCGVYFKQTEIYPGVPNAITSIFPQLFDLMINPLKAFCIVFGTIIVFLIILCIFVREKKRSLN